MKKYSFWDGVNLQLNLIDQDQKDLDSIIEGIFKKKISSRKGMNRDWPENFKVSLSHTDCLPLKGMISALAWGQHESIESLGVDIEFEMDLVKFGEIKNLIALEREYQIFNGQLSRIDPLAKDQLAQATIIFCSKEALYKLLNPLTNQFLDFLDVELIEIMPYGDGDQWKLLFKTPFEGKMRLITVHCFKNIFMDHLYLALVFLR